MTAIAVLAAIPTAPSIIITGWLELNAHIDSLLPLSPLHQTLVTTADLMALWCCTQPTVSRRIAGINRAGLARIERAWGVQGGWWLKR